MGFPSYIPVNFKEQHVTVSVANNVATYNGNQYTNPMLNSDNLADGNYPAVHFKDWNTTSNTAKAGYPSDFICLDVPLSNSIWFMLPYNREAVIKFMSLSWGYNFLAGYSE